jgi:photosystem II stability/assembly factor-like uncharacterized protein
MKNAARRLRHRFLLAGLVSVALSAARVSAGVNVWTTNGPAGTDIRALAITPSNPATLYAGSYGNGVFKSTDSGGTWVRASTGLTTPYISALVVDPAAPATVYAGTGSGVFKTTNSGGAWVAVNTGPANLDVRALAIDPSNPTTLYAGTFRGGVFKSTNSGATWAPVNTGLGSPYIDALAIDPANAATLYAGTVGPQVFKSTDSGGTWSGTGGGFNDPWGYGDSYDLKIDSATPGTLYAATDYGLFKSRDAGRSWAIIDVGLPITIPVSSLAIDSSAPARLYAGTFEAGVFKSTDGGASWTEMNAGLTNLTVHALTIDPSTPARIYAATEAGVYEYLSAEVSTDRRILPVVGSTPGANGTFFRTTVQLHNPGNAAMTGRIVFHPSGVAGSATDAALSYSLTPGQTQSIADLLPAMGMSGLGSADIEITSGGAPVGTARVFNDAGAAGTTGFTEPPVRADEALRSGHSGVLLIPPDFAVARFNVGVRTLDDGASVTFTLRDASGAMVGSRSRALPSNYHQQQDAAGFLSVLTLPPGGSISISVNSGAAIVYGATVDNRTGDPSLQIASAAP